MQLKYFKVLVDLLGTLSNPSYAPWNVAQPITKRDFQQKRA